MDIEKLGKSSILSARCRSKIALVYLTGPAAFGSEAESCVIITHRVVLRENLSSVWDKVKANNHTCAVSENKTGCFDIAIAIIYAGGISALPYL